MMQHDVTRSQWEMNNFVVTDDSFLFPNTELMEELHKTQPWKKSPRYFKRVKVSILAALQMMSHAQRGSPNAACPNDGGTGAASSPPIRSEPRHENWFEVMGLMLGHFTEEEMIVTNAFALPVDASEVECAMNDASQLYMLEYLQYHQRGGTQEGCIGWYHSHPGYTCFLSGTDVSTQQLGQKAQDPWVAVVVDPVRTLSTGMLDMKAFRTFPEDYAAELQRARQQAGGRHCGSPTKSTGVPSERIKEYGVHAHRYYELPITLVRSRSDEAILDCLWSRYWAQTFLSNPLTTNRKLMTQQIHQLTDVLESGLATRQKKMVKDDECQFDTKVRSQEQYADAVGDGDVAHDNNEAFKEKSLQVRYLTSALAAEVALGGVLLVVKSSVFQA
ncbi:metallopeptidase [Trypanosoma conorhini]|uniref:COP9 signalosome complex subunit 5 n=1 Tax=Trypanosoma conorhini TaxID=83891 RepID=A0A3R7LB66_9TRYP|nr:metallopeptidase [Trypanosoma conorhini]RNF23627.1 metallopeptidase [Trypanosoma conorhini]